MSVAGFRVEAELGQGRMSTVMRAIEESSGREVALKILHPHLARNQAVRRRLQREFAAVRRIEHPSIVEIYDILQSDGGVQLVMEYIQGPTVRQKVLDEGAQPWEEVREILDDVLAGLEAAHEAGVLHRDLNAEHILLGTEGAKIAGFGLARVDELVALTMHTRVLGALEAMAPERVLGMSYDGRADLYSVGAVAYELLLGHPPTEGSMGAAFQRARSRQNVEFDRELPREAQYVLERALVGDRSARFATAGQMRRALFGEYDVALWQGWTARNSQPCPSCEAAMIPGLSQCVECGYVVKRLVQRPGAGDKMIRVISPREAFVPDVWFETNNASDYLSTAQVRALMELLGAHEDTREFADGRWEYRRPPYVLVSDLDEVDARQISQQLEQIGIPHQIVGELPKLRRFQIGGKGAGVGLLFGAGLIATMMIVLFGLAWELKVSVIATAVAVMILTMVGTQWVLDPLKRRLSAVDDVERRQGHSFLIETEALASFGYFDGTLRLPAQTGTVMSGLKDRAVARELYELLVLAVAVARGRDQAQVQTLVGQILAVVVELDEELQRSRKRSSAELMDELDRVRIRMEQEEKPELIEERRRILDELAEHDEAVREVADRQAQLLRLRGALLDLRGRDVALEEALEEVKVGAAGEQDDLEELLLLLEVSEEVEALTSAVEVSR